MTAITQYRAMLPVMKHRLDDELEIQPEIMDRISTQVVVANSRMLQAKEDLATTEARVLEDIKDSDEKLTVQQINGKLQRNAERVRAWTKYQEARAEHEAWSHLLEAWRQKGYSIKVLADLYQAQYFTVDSHHLTQRTKDRLERGDTLRSEARKDHGARHIDVRTEGVQHEATTESRPRRRPLA